MQIPFLQQSLKNWGAAFFLIFLTIGLGYGTSQSEFSKTFLFFAPFFAIYIYLLKEVKTKKSIHFFIGIAIFLRFLLLFSYPNLSDDLYRFIWDGRLLTHGYNPFDHLPKYYIDNNINIEGITPELFSKLNSPEYFTIYPPVAQMIFAIAVWLFPNSIYGSALIIKLSLFLFETGAILLIIKLLRRFNLPTKNALIYALNPLIIIEICGNLHFEGAMIYFLLLGVWLLSKTPIVTTEKFTKSGVFSAVAFALSIASKLLPLIFLPFFIKRLGWKKSLLYFSIIGITLLLLFIPLVNGVFIENFSNSLNLYFQKFEFNASTYYVIRWIGYQLIGWNLIVIIGPALAIGTLLSIFLMTVFEKVPKQPISKKQPFYLRNDPVFFTKLLFAICIYLLFTTTVHPWYVALPLVLCSFTRFRFPVLWSGLIMLTYINYSQIEYHENLLVVALEYSLVGLFLIYELILRDKLPQDRYLRD